MAAAPSGPPDLVEAAARWGGCPSGGLPCRVSDVWRWPARWSLARSLGRAARLDPGTFWTTAIAIRRYRALQKPLELFEYLRLLKDHRPVNLLEIGTLWGGLFYAHCACLAEAGHAIAIDAFPRESGDDLAARFRHFARRRQQVTCVWGDSHDPQTLAAVKTALQGEPLDLLLLDGDHTVEGAERDYAAFGPLVRPGGLVAFHDIEGESGMAKLWQTLRPHHDTIEFVDRVHPPAHLGIGVIRTAAEGEGPDARLDQGHERGARS